MPVFSERSETGGPPLPRCVKPGIGMTGMEVLKQGRWLDARPLEIAARTLLGVGAGYALSALLAAALSLALPMARAEAVMVATMLAFLAYVVFIIWAYAAANVWRLAGIWAVLAGVLWLVKAWGAQA